MYVSVPVRCTDDELCRASTLRLYVRWCCVHGHFESEVIRYFYYILTVFWSSLNENWWCCAEKKYCKRKCRVTFCPDEMSVDTKFTPILLNWNPSNYCYQVQNMVHKSIWWHGSIAVVRQCTYGLWETLSTVTWCEDTCGEDLVQRNTKWWKWLKSEALMNRKISQKCRWMRKISILRNVMCSSSSSFLTTAEADGV